MPFNSFSEKEERKETMSIEPPAKIVRLGDDFPFVFPFFILN